MPLPTTTSTMPTIATVYAEFNALHAEALGLTKPKEPRSYGEVLDQMELLVADVRFALQRAGRLR